MKVQMKVTSILSILISGFTESKKSSIKKLVFSVREWQTCYRVIKKMDVILYLKEKERLDTNQTEVFFTKTLLYSNYLRIVLKTAIYSFKQYY